jgi:hypothetical protein
LWLLIFVEIYLEQVCLNSESYLYKQNDSGIIKRFHPLASHCIVSHTTNKVEE